MSRLIRIGQLTHTTIDDEQEHELARWTGIEERSKSRSGPRSFGTLFKDGQAVAFFDRTARYFYLVDPSLELPGGSRGATGRFVSLPEAIHFYAAHGAFSKRETTEQR